MKCTDFERELCNRWETRRPNLTAAAQEHLSACPACRGLYQRELALDRLVAVWREQLPEPPPAAPLVEALCREFGVRRPTTPPTRRAAMLWATVSAMAVLLCVGLVLSWTKGSMPPTGRLVAERSTETAASGEDWPLTDSVATLWDGVQSQSQQVAVNTVRRLEDWPQLTRQERWESGSASVPSPSGDANDRPWGGWGEPLGRQVGQAFRFLSDALPDAALSPAG